MAVIASKVVPTEYDIEETDGLVVLVDDRSRRFIGSSVEEAFELAESVQDPADPIHHEPYPSPADAPQK